MALLHAYAQRCFGVGPMTRSASSWNGTAVLLPYTSDVEKMTTSLPFLLRVREHDLGAVHVGLDRADRRLDDELHADGGGQVEHDVGAIDELGRQRLVHDRVDHVLEAGTALEVGDVVHRAGRQVVDHHDLMAAASSASARCDPTNPAPPVSRAFILYSGGFASRPLTRSLARRASREKRLGTSRLVTRGSRPDRPLARYVSDRTLTRPRERESPPRSAGQPGRPMPTHSGWRTRLRRR